MKIKTVLSTVIIIAVLMGAALSCRQSPPVYSEDWESLKTYPTADWFRDAKFGIYTHWGAYSVPAFGNEWYPRSMYNPESRENAYHREKFGDPSAFGYKDFIPLFTAENFNADEWADLFKRAGAQFAGPVAEHHDGFAMWDSALTEWDASDKGPKRDIVGELARAVRARGMKFVTSFHHAFNWKYFEPSYTEDHNHDTQDPRFAAVDGLFPPPHASGAPESEEFLQDWEAKIREVIDKYQPDYLWFDFGWKEPPFEPYKKSVIAYYYNKSREWEKDVVVTYKHDHLPTGVGILDLERGKLNKLTDFVWITDTSVDRRSWCYIQNPEYKSLDTLVDNLVDRVSKNGNLLLNIGPRLDGTIPPEQQELLLGIGDWLKINGEAIYGTRPWQIFGEGPTVEEGGAFVENKNLIEYSAQDIRFTTRGDVLYAIALAWPEANLTVESLAGLDVRSVKLLGTETDLQWETAEEGLRIEMPTSPPCKHAYCFKILLK